MDLHAVHSSTTPRGRQFAPRMFQPSSRFNTTSLRSGSPQADLLCSLPGPFANLGLDLGVACVLVGAFLPPPSHFGVVCFGLLGSLPPLPWRAPLACFWLLVLFGFLGLWPWAFDGFGFFCLLLLWAQPRGPLAHGPSRALLFSFVGWQLFGSAPLFILTKLLLYTALTLPLSSLGYAYEHLAVSILC